METLTPSSLEYEDSSISDESNVIFFEDESSNIEPIILHHRYSKNPTFPTNVIGGRFEKMNSITEVKYSLSELNAEIGLFLYKFTNLFRCFRISNKQYFIDNKIDFIATHIVSHIIKITDILEYPDSIKSQIDKNWESIIERMDLLCDTFRSPIIHLNDIILSKNKNVRHAYKVYTLCKRVGRTVDCVKHSLRYSTCYDKCDIICIINVISKFVDKFSGFVLTLANDINQ